MTTSGAVLSSDIDTGVAALKSGQYSNALNLLIPLANGGNSEAQRIVGEMCYNGQGMKRDAAASFKWTEIAAEDGNKIAQYNLGYLYEKGEGTQASLTQAINWYTKSAIQGYPSAQHKLGDLYAATDRSKAIYWYDSAQQSGDEVARKKFSALSSEKYADLVASRAREYSREQAEEQARREENEREARSRREEQEARDAEDRQSSRQASANLGAQIINGINQNFAILPTIDRQTNAAYAETNRRLAAQTAERNRASAERDEREAERRRDAARERAAREEAARDTRARAVASQPEPPKYQPQVVVLPKADLVCKPGWTWYDSTGTGAKGGTCYKNTQGQTQTQVASNTNSSTGSGSNSNSGSDQQPSASGTTTRTQTSDSSGSNSQSDPSGSTTPTRQPPKVEWGPIQLEALAICRKSEKNGKWWCDGPGQDLIIFDSPTVEDALVGVGCDSGIASVGGTTKDGKKAEVYRCGYGLRSYDRNIAKIHGLVNVQRSYMCPKNHGDHCTDFYDGQDKR